MAMGNVPMMYVDPDGEWAFLVPIIVGAVVNTAANWDHITSADNFWQGLGRAGGYALTGGAAGAATLIGGPAGFALSGAVGGLGNGLMQGKTGADLWTGVGIGAVAGLAGGVATTALPGVMSGSPILNGMIKGAVGGAAGGFVGGGLASAAYGGNFWDGAWSGMKSGAMTGALVGGAVEGYQASRNGFNPLTGNRTQGWLKANATPGNLQGKSVSVAEARVSPGKIRPLSGPSTSSSGQVSTSGTRLFGGDIRSIQVEPFKLSPRQGLHYGSGAVAGKSQLSVNPQNLLNQLNTGNYNPVRVVGGNKWVVDFGQVIGNHAAGPTQYGMVHMNSAGQIHIVPANPVQY